MAVLYPLLDMNQPLGYQVTLLRKKSLIFLGKNSIRTGLKEKDSGKLKRLIKVVQVLGLKSSAKQEWY